MKISKLFIDEDVIDFPAAKSILSRLNMQYEIVSDHHRVYDFINASEHSIQLAKETLFITKNKGAFIRDCPGTSCYTCCGYKILHIGTFCSMDCSYCILQSYFHPPVLQFFVNHEDMTNEINLLFENNSISRVGTGEFTDSLIWESLMDFSGMLVNKFSKQNRAVLELKTKTINIKFLKELSHNRKTIVSWSLNTEKVIREEERKTSSLNARLEAAALCESWGYPVSFHFDPVIIYDGCEEEYKKVIQKIFSYVSPDNIVWISIGTFRFIPPLKNIIKDRFFGSKIAYGEFITGLDGKMRYFKPLRIDIYKKIVGWIKEISPDVLVYFCMEDDEVWEKSTGFIPEKYGGLSALLDRSAVIHCGLQSEQ
ncbi:MAG: DNA photolyase [Proteobacteria bacterium]|nr:DNA photolyase [Pseudomonadota bacterium]